MNKRYGVVLIGCGHIGQEHIEDIYFRDNIRVVATVDTREEQARLFARACPVRKAHCRYPGGGGGLLPSG